MPPRFRQKGPRIKLLELAAGFPLPQPVEKAAESSLLHLQLTQTLPNGVTDRPEATEAHQPARDLVGFALERRIAQGFAASAHACGIPIGMIVFTRLASSASYSW